MTSFAVLRRTQLVLLDTCFADARLGWFGSVLNYAGALVLKDGRRLTPSLERWRSWFDFSFYNAGALALKVVRHLAPSL